jgi:hypothetical protein
MAGLSQNPNSFIGGIWDLRVLSDTLSREALDPLAQAKVRKVIEYHIHTSCCSDSRDTDLDILPGKEWRKAKQIAANPDLYPWGDIHWVEKVTIWYSYAEGGIDREEEDLFYRHDPHQGQPCPNHR